MDWPGFIFQHNNQKDTTRLAKAYTEYNNIGMVPNCQTTILLRTYSKELKLTFILK